MHDEQQIQNEIKAEGFVSINIDLGEYSIYDLNTNKDQEKDDMKDDSLNLFPCLCIIDWDNTLLCSDALRYLTMENLDENFESTLQNYINNNVNPWWSLYDNLYCEIFQKLYTSSNICILTNAGYDWFLTTCRLFFPQFFSNFIDNQKLYFVSARSEYELLIYDYDQCFQWKLHAAKDCIKHFYNDLTKLEMIITIGDKTIDHVCIFPFHYYYNADIISFKIKTEKNNPMYLLEWWKRTYKKIMSLIQ